MDDTPNTLQAQVERAAYLEHLEAEIEAHPTWPDLKLRLAILRDGDLDAVSARALLDAALELNPRYLGARVTRAVIAGREDPSAADEDLQVAREEAKDAATSPGAAAVALACARALVCLRRGEEALALLPADPPVGAARPPLLFLRARVLTDLGLDEAAQAKAKAVAAFPDLEASAEVGPYGGGLPPLGFVERQIALYLAEQDEPAWATYWLGRALESDLKLASDLEAKGEICFAAGEIDEAVRLFERAIEVAPELARARVSCAYAFGVLERPDDAVAQLRAALENHSRYADLHYELATLLSDRGDAEGAVRHLETALVLNPRYLDALYALGVLRASAGDDSAAAEALGRAYDAGLDHDELRTELGLACLSLGEVERAREVLDPLRDDDPDGMDSAACLALGLLEHEGGDDGGARAWLARYRATELEFGDAALAGSNRRLAERVDALEAVLQSA